MKIELKENVVLDRMVIAPLLVISLALRVQSSVKKYRLECPVFAAISDEFSFTLILMDVMNTHGAEFDVTVRGTIGIPIPTRKKQSKCLDCQQRKKRRRSEQAKLHMNFLRS